MKLSKLVLSLTLGVALVSGSALADTATFTRAETGTLAAVANIDIGEILVSKVALNKTQNKGVITLAKMMVTQHSSNLTQILSMGDDQKKLSRALNKGVAEDLAEANNHDLTTLGALEGSKFDYAYVDAMVSGHEAALKLIDDKLMKSAESDQMKKFLTDTRATVVKHLDAAKALQKEMQS